jgi:hypothetical protein
MASVMLNSAAGAAVGGVVVGAGAAWAEIKTADTYNRSMRTTACFQDWLGGANLFADD